MTPIFTRIAFKQRDRPMNTHVFAFMGLLQLNYLTHCSSFQEKWWGFVFMKLTLRSQQWQFKGLECKKIKLLLSSQHVPGKG